MKKPTPNDQTEAWVKKQVRQILEDTGWKSWMPNAGAFGRSGISDFLAVKRPKLFMAIETKYDDIVTPLQFEFLTSIHEAGHYAFVVDETNVDEFRELLIHNLPNRLVEITFKSLLKWQDQENKPYDIRISAARKLDV